MKEEQLYIENAIPFCGGAKMSLNQQLAASSEFNVHIQNSIQKTKNDPFYNKISFEKLTELTAKFTRDNVDQDGDAWNDFNSVGWHMGILCYIWEHSLTHINVNFDNVFIEAWHKYFGIKNEKQDIREKEFAEIINKGECLSSINGKNSFDWKDENIKHKAGKSEWLRHNFYPADGMVGEIVDRFENPIWGGMIYVLKIGNNLYVPMSKSGIKLISKDEFDSKSQIIRNVGVDRKTSILHSKEKSFHENINKRGSNPLNFTSVEKRAVFKILLELMHADGKVDIGELQYSIKIKELLSLDSEDIDQAKRLNSLSTINSIQQMNDLKKAAFKLMMVEMIGADGDTDNIDENELFYGVCVACQL